ncbi:RNA polymerase sigma factor SigM [Rhodococcus sp. NM-2]|uniref:RNA polymerase sigma factor SigM n=1 Tax=unclassified Rhodococcus (in: high G+C Gram-positive bacteria) TaxID=192944 RepID=UPI0024B6D0B9|nr:MULTISPECIES: RNA polymerase sigma factor SigM [unclassified Rhodococcus (in: high G+C Gram-positive bacteria)]MDI9954298.1 RNA polymerase sigma factor SigM [Rhodococcus sp. IEGM 1305]MDI9977575.1 RNA polymerase sigma factor SigM [Rhodococcus sp. IEGM 1307]
MRIFRGDSEGEPSDVDLLAAHVAGDRHAFETLLSRHYDHLWHVAKRTSYTTEDAADALQEALLSAHRNAGSFRRDAAVRSWLHTIVVNACLDRIRRNKARPAVSLSADEDDEPSDTRDYVSEVELSMVVERALAQLPPDQRTAIVAVDLEGRSTSEAAALLGVPEGTVKSRCARGRKKLAASLEYFRVEGNRS